MFKIISSAIFFTTALPLFFSCSNLQSKQSANVLPVVKKSNGLHVIELFTSEGCSSCPPADKLLSNIKAEGDSNVFVLSYHVDYWDHLGWKDAFSQAAFSDRQRQYAQRFSLESIYTPQVIVNGEEEFVGSDEKRLRASLQKSNIAPIAIQASAQRTANRTVQVSYNLPSASLLNVALVQPEATTDVKRGENEGRSIHHVNVVRDFKTVDAQPKGTIEFSLPAALVNSPLLLVLFTEEKRSKKITGATQLMVSQ